MDDKAEKSSQQVLVETIWTYTGWTVVIFACIGAGVWIGHMRWGDSTALRLKVDQYEKQFTALKNERDAVIAKLTQERDACQKAASAGPLSPTGAPVAASGVRAE
jgi:predicted negative regulator of RcsB-dependent stress response